MNITQIKRQRSPHQPVGRWIRVDKRLAIYLRDEFRCQICRKNLTKSDPFDITLDHLIPKAKGGSNHESNLFTCCRSCNSSRQVQELPRRVAVHIRYIIKIDIAAYRKLAQSIVGDRYEVSMSRAKKCTKRAHICECTNCGFKTAVVGLEACPGCNEAA